MAVDARIPLGVQVPDVSNSLTNALMMGNRLKMSNALLDQQNRQDRRQGEMHDARMGQLGEQNKLQAIQAVYEGSKALLAVPPEQRQQAYEAFANQLTQLGYDKALGIDVTQMDDDLSDQGLQQTIAGLEGFVGRQAGNTAGVQEFNYLTKGLTPEQVEQARRIKLGLDPRAVGSASITIAEGGKTGAVASSEAVIEGAKAGAKEEAKLIKQYRLKPELEAKVTAAVSDAKAYADQKTTNRSNAVAMDVYQQAMTGLVTSLGGTATGPVYGLLPAITADQQIADGAVAAMAPILKQIFRSAGEGQFTDKDQQLLLDMVPGRKDHPETIAAKIGNIDAIIKAKLGAQGAEQPAQAAQFREGQTATGPGGQKVVFTNGQWVPQ